MNYETMRQVNQFTVPTKKYNVESERRRKSAKRDNLKLRQCASKTEYC